MLLPTLHFEETPLSLERFFRPASRYQKFLKKTNLHHRRHHEYSVCNWTLNLASLCPIFLKDFGKCALVELLGLMRLVEKTDDL